MADDHYDRLAANGAALFDEKLPGWWRVDIPHAIDLDTLDLGSACNCILGQTWDEKSDPEESYVLHAERLFGPNYPAEAPAQYGFDLLSNDPYDNYDRLTDAWERIIVARRTEAARSSKVASR